MTKKKLLIKVGRTLVYVWLHVKRVSLRCGAMLRPFAQLDRVSRDEIASAVDFKRSAQ